VRRPKVGLHPCEYPVELGDVFLDLGTVVPAQHDVKSR